MNNRYKELNNTEKNIVDQLINCIASHKIEGMKLLSIICKAQDKIRLTNISNKFLQESYIG